MMSFDELCGSALGAADYTAISEAFHTIFVHGVPMMSLVHLNQVRRGEARQGGLVEAPPVWLVSLNDSYVPVGNVAYCGLCDYWLLRLEVGTHKTHFFSARTPWDTRSIYMT